MNANAKLKLGMIGGGPGAGIAVAHRKAIQLDGSFEIVAGAFSRSVESNRAMQLELGIFEDRLYESFIDLAQKEAKRSDRIDCALIVAPNDVHAPASLELISHGIPVICEKPISNSTSEAQAILELATSKNVPFALTHNYSAYPMVFEARERIASGEIGNVRVVHVEYAQGGRSTLVEKSGDQKTAWRMNPEIGGPSTVLGDIGTHALHLLRRITGLEVTEVSADISTMVAGRVGDDNANINLRMTDDVRGHLWASMVANGNGHGLKIRVFGEQGSLEWVQEEPERLWLRSEKKPSICIRRGEPWTHASAKQFSHVKAGHPQGFIEGFANIYSDFADVLRARNNGAIIDPKCHSFATAFDGLVGMDFIETAIRSSRSNGAWCRLETPFSR